MPRYPKAAALSQPPHYGRKCFCASIVDDEHVDNHDCDDNTDDDHDNNNDINGHISMNYR